MKRLSYLLLSTCIVCLSSCGESQLIDAQPEQKEVSQDMRSSGYIGIGKTVNKNGIQIEFIEVSGDTRCAEGLKCLWEGNAQVVLLVAKDSEVQTLSLNTFGDSRFPKSRVFSGYELSLRRLHPYPRNNTEIDPADYEVELLIKPAQKGNSPVIIDVRTEEEFSKGHYPNALNIEYQNIATLIGQYQLAKDEPIIVYCRSGKRAGKAKEFLEKAGYTNVTNGVSKDAVHKKLGTMPKN